MNRTPIIITGIITIATMLIVYRICETIETATSAPRVIRFALERTDAFDIKKGENNGND